MRTFDLKMKTQTTLRTFFNIASMKNFFIFGHACHIWKFPSQGLNSIHSHDPSHSSDNTGSLTYCATRELQEKVFFFFFLKKKLIYWGKLFCESNFVNFTKTSKLQKHKCYLPLTNCVSRSNPHTSKNDFYVRLFFIVLTAIAINWKQPEYPLAEYG